MALLLSQLRATGLIDELRLIVEKLSRAASTCELVAFESFYIPLLSKLIDEIIIEPNILHDYRALFRNVLSFYVKRYIQPEPPADSWARKSAGCGASDCPDCADLDRFLLDPRQRSKGFPRCSSERFHLHQQLNRTKHSHETDHTETLIVTKALETKDIRHGEWIKRAYSAQENISGFNQVVLKRLSGSKYSHIVDLHAVRKGPHVIDLT